MHNSISLFNKIYNKFMKKYYENNPASNLNLTGKDEYYLDLLFCMENPTASGLAIEANISKPAATQIIHKFIEKGYVSKIQSETDRRTNYLQLDEKIQHYFSESYAALDQLYLNSLNFLSDEEIKEIDKILKKIDRNL